MTTKNRIFICLATLLAVISLTGTAAARSHPKIISKPGQKIRVYTADIEHFYAKGLMAGIRNDTLLIGNEGKVRIDAATTTDRTVFKFPFPGASYDRDAETVSGFDDTGNLITLALSEIDYVDVTLHVQKQTFTTKFNASTLKKRLQGEDYHPQLQKIPLESVTAIEVWHKKPKGPVLAAGAVVGLAIGLVIGEAAYQDSKDDFISFSREALLIISGATWSLGGLWLANLMVGDDKWEKVPIEEVSLGLAPASEPIIRLSLTYEF